MRHFLHLNKHDPQFFFSPDVLWIKFVHGGIKAEAQMHECVHANSQNTQVFQEFVDSSVSFNVFL